MTSAILECQNVLLQMALQKGYLTFNEILDTADLFSLTVSEIDEVSEIIQLRGILVYENEPILNKQSEELVDRDYSRIDYNTIYSEVVEIDSDLRPLICQIRKLPTAQYGEVLTLTKQLIEGNVFARKRIITIHLRLVIKIALSMAQEYELNLSECISAGFVGLITATNRFDPSGFTAFQAFASLLIKQNIQRECVPDWMKVYYPTYYRDKLISMVRFFKNYYGKYIPKSLLQEDIENIKQELSLSYEEICEYHQVCYSQLYENIELDLKTNSELDEILYKAEYSSTDTIFDIISKKILKKLILNITSILKKREQYVLIMRYGLDNSDGCTLEEVGNSLGLTRERIRQIEANAIRKLTHSNYAKEIKEFWE